MTDDAQLVSTLNNLNSTMSMVANMLGGQPGFPTPHFAPTASQVMWGNQQARWNKAYYESVGLLDPRATAATSLIGNALYGDNVSHYTQNVAPSVLPIVSRMINMPGVSSMVGGSIYDMGMGVSSAVSYSGAQVDGSSFLGPGTTSNAMSLSVMRESLRHFFTEEGLSRPDRAHGFGYSEIGEVFSLMRDKGTFAGLNLGTLVDNGAGQSIPSLNRDAINRINQEVQDAAEVLRAVKDITNSQSIQELARTAESFTGASLGKGGGSRLALQRLTGFAASAEAAGLDPRRYLEMGAEMGSYLNMQNPGATLMNRELTAAIMTNYSRDVAMARQSSAMQGIYMAPDEGASAAWMTNRVAEESGVGGVNQLLYAAQHAISNAPEGSSMYKSAQALLAAYNDPSLTEAERRRAVHRHAADGGLASYINTAGGVDNLMSGMSASDKDSVTRMISDTNRQKARSDWAIVSGQQLSMYMDGRMSADEARLFVDELSGDGRGMVGASDILDKFADGTADRASLLRDGLSADLINRLSSMDRSTLSSVRSAMATGFNAVHGVGTESAKQREEQALRELHTHSVWAATGDGPALGIKDSILWGLAGRNVMPEAQTASIALSAGMGIDLSSLSNVRGVLVESGMSSQEIEALLSRHTKNGKLSAEGMLEVKKRLTDTHAVVSATDTEAQQAWMRFVSEERGVGRASTAARAGVENLLNAATEQQLRDMGFSSRDEALAAFRSLDTQDGIASFGAILSPLLEGGSATMHAIRRADMERVKAMRPRWERYQSMADGNRFGRSGATIADVLGISIESMANVDMSNNDAFDQWHKTNVSEADVSVVERNLKDKVIGRTDIDASVFSDIFGSQHFEGMLRNIGEHIDEKLTNKDLSNESRQRLEQNRQVINDTLRGQSGNYIGKLVLENGHLVADMYKGGTATSTKGGN